MMKKLLFLSAVLCAAASCGEAGVDGNGDEPKDAKISIDVTTSNLSRAITAEDLTVAWEDGDALGAYLLGTTTINEFAMTNFEASKSTFEGEAEADFRLVYPYSADAFAYANGNYTFDLSEQTSGFGETCMVSTTTLAKDATEATMTCVGSVIDLNLTFVDLDSEIITIEKAAINGVCSSVTVNLNNDSSADDFVAAGDGEAIEVAVNGTEKIAEGVAQHIIFTVPSNSDIADGLSVDLYLTDGESDHKLSVVIPNTAELACGSYSQIDYECNLYGVLKNITYEVWDGTVATSFAAGAGTAENPYQISNGAELAYLSQLVVAKDAEGKIGDGLGNQCFVLTNNIDLANIEWTPIGSMEVQQFKGVFDGAGHYIKNLTYTGNHWYAGLFGMIAPSTVRVFDENGDFVGYEPTENVSVVKNVLVSGSLKSDMATIGGIVGYTSGVSIYNCAFEGTVEGATGAWLTAGLICGDLEGETVCLTNCYAIGKVIAKSSLAYGAGGIVGQFASAKASINNCYFVGTIEVPSTGLARSGSICGTAVGVTNDSYAIDTTGATGEKGSYGTTMTESEMTNASFLETLNANVANYEGACPWGAGAVYPTFNF